MLIAQSLTGGKLDPGEAGMLTGVFHLHEQQARQVMTPAPAVVTVDLSENVETALRRCVSSGHTRLVVTEDENPDRVKGIVHANALAQLLLAEGPEAAIDGLVRDAPIVPETKPLDDLLADLQRRAQLAGGRASTSTAARPGIVTVEDIIEEVVGEIDDETDPIGGAVRRLSNGDWFVRGHVAITDLVDYGLELPVDSDAYNSVGGFVFGELGRLPKRGDTVQHNGYSIRVESVRENRIEAVRIRARRTGIGLSPARRASSFVAARLRRRYNRKRQPPRRDLVARGHLGLPHAAAVDPGAVRGAEVAQHPATLDEPQLRVAARDGVVGEHELAGGRAAEHQLPGREALERREVGRAATQRRQQLAQAGEPRRRRGGEIGGQAVELAAAGGVQRTVDAALERLGVQAPGDVAAPEPRDRSLPGLIGWTHLPGPERTSPSTVANQNPVRNCTNGPDTLRSLQPTGRFGG